MGDRMIRIRIKQLGGKIVSLTLDRSTTVAMIKQWVQEEEGDRPEDQRIVFRGRQLEGDNLTLSDCNVEDMDTLHVVLQLRGQGDMLANHAQDLTPAARSKDVPITTPISVKLDDDVRGLTPAVAADLLKLREGTGGGSLVAGTCRLIPASRTLVFTPRVALKCGTRYYVTGGTTGLQIGDGRHILRSGLEWTFKTAESNPVRLTLLHAQDDPLSVTYNPGVRPRHHFLSLVQRQFRVPEDQIVRIQLSVSVDDADDPVLEEDRDFLALRDGDIVQITSRQGSHTG